MITTIFRIVAQFMAALFCFIPALIGSYTTGSNYTIPQIDLSAAPAGVSAEFAELYEQTVVDDSRNYLAHPDSILLKNGNILTMYPAGHGKGAVLNKVSTDGGRSYSSTIANTPASWVNSQETPTVYRLQFTDEQMQDKLIMISANPDWGSGSTGGFNCSLSSDEGENLDGIPNLLRGRAVSEGHPDRCDEFLDAAQGKRPVCRQMDGHFPRCEVHQF